MAACLKRKFEEISASQHVTLLSLPADVLRLLFRYYVSVLGRRMLRQVCSTTKKLCCDIRPIDIDHEHRHTIWILAAKEDSPNIMEYALSRFPTKLDDNIPLGVGKLHYVELMGRSFKLGSLRVTLCLRARFADDFFSSDTASYFALQIRDAILKDRSDLVEALDHPSLRDQPQWSMVNEIISWSCTMPDRKAQRVLNWFHMRYPGHFSGPIGDICMVNGYPDTLKIIYPAGAGLTETHYQHLLRVIAERQRPSPGQVQILQWFDEVQCPRPPLVQSNPGFSDQSDLELSESESE